MKILVLAVVVTALAYLPSLHGIDVNQPILASDYVAILKQGFATNYFKTLPPGKKYQKQNIQDIAVDFGNLRLRSEAGLYDPPYASNADFAEFLDKLEEVVDECLAHNVNPVISWIHHHAEAYATADDKVNYISWWTLVADRLKNKNYRLSFNLFTELGIDACGNNCDGSLRENKTKYHEWTRDVIPAIRGTGANNAQRIIIITSPDKTAKGLPNIESSIYENDQYMMAEFHLYASGPNHISGSAKEWRDDGNVVGKENVRNSVDPAVTWSQSTGIPLYFAAWMPQDNTYGALTEFEVKKFARYFVLYLKEKGIPWSVNVLDRYYDTEISQWITGDQVIKGQTLNMATVLNTIKNNM